MGPHLLRVQAPAPKPPLSGKRFVKNLLKKIVKLCLDFSRRKNFEILWNWQLLFHAKKKLLFCHSTENSEKLGKFVKLKITTFIWRKNSFFCHWTERENPEKNWKFVKLKRTTFISRKKLLFCHLTENLEKTLKIREIDNFYFTQKNCCFVIWQKIGKTWQIREI